MLWQEKAADGYNTNPPNSNPPIVAEINEKVSCRLYEDTRPYYLEIAPLQKGLVLVLDGKELIEEGAGLGVPVIIYKDEPYFSSTAKTTIIQQKKPTILMKSFVMDSVSRKKFGTAGYVNKRLYFRFHKLFQNFYVRKTHLTPVFNKGIELMKLFGINTEFVKVQPRGIVNIKYTCNSELASIKIGAIFNQLSKNNCQEIILLNEQGASFFRKYSDSNGQILMDEEIGAWTQVNATEASLANTSDTLSFSLKKMENAHFLRGREKIPNRYSWVGFSYSIHPKSNDFSYSIKLETKKF
jgi:hypothetical protein